MLWHSNLTSYVLQAEIESRDARIFELEQQIRALEENATANNAEHEQLVAKLEEKVCELERKMKDIEDELARLHLDDDAPAEDISLLGRVCRFGRRLLAAEAEKEKLSQAVKDLERERDLTRAGLEEAQKKISFHEERQRRITEINSQMYGA
jgi:predicted  nucleic acid-binding Zn-ribbon protein